MKGNFRFKLRFKTRVEMEAMRFNVFIMVMVLMSLCLISCGSNPSIRGVGSTPSSGSGNNDSGTTKNGSNSQGETKPPAVTSDPNVVKIKISLESLSGCGVVADALKSFRVPKITAQSVTTDFYATGVTDDAAIASVALPLNLDLTRGSYETQITLPAGLGSQQVAFSVCDLLSVDTDPRYTGCYNMENLNHNLVLTSTTVGSHLGGYVAGMSANQAEKDGLNLVFTCATASPGYVLN